jgi:hypothetical protein
MALQMDDPSREPHFFVIKSSAAEEVCQPSNKRERERERETTFVLSLLSLSQGAASLPCVYFSKKKKCWV